MRVWNAGITLLAVASMLGSALGPPQLLCIGSNGHRAIEIAYSECCDHDDVPFDAFGVRYVASNADGQEYIDLPLPTQVVESKGDPSHDSEQPAIVPRACSSHVAWCSQSVQVFNHRILHSDP